MQPRTSNGGSCAVVTDGVPCTNSGSRSSTLRLGGRLTVTLDNMSWTTLSAPAYEVTLCDQHRERVAESYASLRRGETDLESLQLETPQVYDRVHTSRYSQKYRLQPASVTKDKGPVPDGAELIGVIGQSNSRRKVWRTPRGHEFTTWDVRRWAEANGLLPESDGSGGRLARQILDNYVQTH